MIARFSALKYALFLVLFTALLVPARAAEQFSGQILGGTPDAPVRIEVFSDFQCPSCRELYLDVIRKVLADYSSQNKVCVIYHEFPLQMHQYSRETARYAEAVSRLGREQMIKVYDSLFMDQAQWSEDGSVAASVAKALTRAEFQKLKKMMEDPAINATIDKEVKLGTDYQIKSTPTFFIYLGRKQLQRVEGRLTYIALKQYLDTIIK
jgi:protein-disulfide isomerase